MCVNCICAQVDITEGIPKHLEAYWCKGCGRYYDPPTTWIVAELESRELMTYCLKRIRGLKHVKLIDASWVWTEPHSKRLKVKLKIQKEVFNSTILQQEFIVEYVVVNHFCSNCHRVEASQTWVAVAQVRQKVYHKRTFYWLEQVILKHKAHLDCVSVQEFSDGLDFYFTSQSHCMKFVDFLQAVIPLRYKTSKHQISADLKSNTYNYKYTYSIEIPPICKEDLVCLPKRFQRALGGIFPLVVCYKLSNSICVIDPFSLDGGYIGAEYWKDQFRSVADRTRLTEYMVLDIELLGKNFGKFALADATVCRMSDLGFNDQQFFTRTHLGNILNPGDTCVGYDLVTSNFNDADFEPMKGKQIPSDVVLIKKTYPGKRKSIKSRHWKLDRMTKEGVSHMRQSELEREERDYEMFMRDLEEDPELREQINLFKVPNAEEIYTRNKSDPDAMVEDDEFEEEEDFPEVELEELQDLIENLTITEQSMEQMAGP
eukprot:TRINITY_DN8594_c0_g1_i1.p1 TRINITY_DN8594_c0_g1~~TRINITY_DN8594_c0_g1_i1.p1  ORF type:complete len:528 (-),score=120.52 TRINITY_DN8594_c0_g1_i1:105-1562(-)